MLLLFCDPWRPQQEERQLPRPEHEQDVENSHEEDGEEEEEEDSASFAPTPVKKTTMLFFGQRQPQHKAEEAHDAATPATVGTHVEDDDDDDEASSPRVSSVPQTPMIRMKNFFATPARPPPPTASRTVESAWSHPEGSSERDGNEDTWIPIEQEDASACLPQSISRTLDFDALLLVGNGGVAEKETNNGRDERPSSSRSSPFKYMAMTVVLALVVMSANNTHKIVQERRAVFRGAHVASPAEEPPKPSERTSYSAMPETLSGPSSFQDFLGNSETDTREESSVSPPTVVKKLLSPTETSRTSSDISWLVFWRSPSSEPKAQFFPWLDVGMEQAKEWTIQTLQQTHRRLLEFADFLRTHKEEREFQRQIHHDYLQERKETRQ
jgi:hypothetical protein